ncbi:hypothetical protein QZK58_18250, partial [Acinetobacter baumannii]|nr:hypothetical protein [Acinetobacter baumannii]
NQGWVGVVFTTQEKRRSWTMLEGYFTVPEGMAQLHPWLQVSAWDTVPNEGQSGHSSKSKLQLVCHFDFLSNLLALKVHLKDQPRL